MTAAEYNVCVDKYADSLFRFVLKNIKDRDSARDIVQDTFEKVWLKVDKVEFEKAKSYLFTTGYHTLIDKIRKEKQVIPLEDYHEEKMHSHNRFSDVRKVLDKALNTLSEIQRSVVLLRDYEGYSYEEIGEITGLNESQVKVYIYRARLALKSYLVRIDNLV